MTDVSVIITEGDSPDVEVTDEPITVTVEPAPVFVVDTTEDVYTVTVEIPDQITVEVTGGAGPQGEPGGAQRGYYYPESHGAIGGGLDDDGDAIRAAFAEAAAAGGGTVLFSQAYGATGEITQPSYVNAEGVSTAAFGFSSIKIIALDDTFRYRLGDQTGPGANPYPGTFRNIVIDGDNIGGAEELLRVECSDTTLENPVVVNGVGNGLVLSNAQNVTIINPRIHNFPDGTGYLGVNNDEAVYDADPTSGVDIQPYNGQGPGHNVVIGGHITSCKRLFHFTYDVIDPELALNFWPHDNIFIGTIFEQYQESVELLGRLSDGEVRFSHCTFTGSSGMSSVDEDCLILIENELRPTLPTYASFDSCDFGGGASGVSHLIRSNSFGVANAIRIYGKTAAANLNKGYFLCDDRTGGGLGVIGGAFGPIDGIITDDRSLAVLDAATAVNTFTVTSGYSDLTVGQKVHVIDTETGDYLAQAVTITALTGPDQVTLSGSALTTTAGDYLMRQGVRLSTGINGGDAGVFATEIRTPIRLRMDSFQGLPLQFRRNGETKNRLQITRDGTMQWLDGDSAVVRGSILRNSDNHMWMSGVWEMRDGWVRQAAQTFFSVDAAWTIDAADTTTALGVFLLSGADATSVTISNGSAGAQLRIGLYGTGTNVVTWPASTVIKFRTAAPQPVNGEFSFVDLLYYSGQWWEVGRTTLVTPGGGTITSVNGYTGPAVTLTASDVGAQPVDSDLTAIAALSTTSYGRDFLTLANQAALIALLPAYQPLDGDLTNIAALSTVIYGRSLLTLSSANALTSEILASSETQSGRIEIATQTETNTGTDDVRAVTPLKLQTRMAAYAQPLDSDLTAIAALTTTAYGRALLELANQAALMGLLSAATETASGIAEIATQTETNTGTDDVRFVTPLKLQTRLAAFAQPLDSDLTSIAALSTTTYGRALLELANQAALMGLLSASSTTAQGIVELATDAETITGTDTARAVTPSNITAMFDDMAHSERTESSQSISTGGTPTVVNWSTSSVAERGGLSFSSGVFTVGTAGTYMVRVYVSFPNAAGARRQIQIRKNGVVGPQTNQTPPTTGVWSSVTTEVLDYAANDTIDVRVFQDSGGSLTLTASIAIHRIA